MLRRRVKALPESQAMWCRPIIPAHSRLRQKDHTFKGPMDSRVSSRPAWTTQRDCYFK